jgi:PAS domain S-box-containing protein
MFSQDKNKGIENRFRDELETRAIKFLKFSIIMVSTLFACLFILNNVITVQHYKGSNLVYALLSIFSILLVFAVYKGFKKFSAYTLTFLVWSALIFLVWNGGKIFDLANYALLVVILFSAIIINRNAAIVVSVLSLANYWLIIILKGEELIRPSVSTINMGRDYTAIMITTILIVYIYENTIRNSLYQIAGLLYQKELDQEKILKTEQSYREIFESIDDAIFILDSTNGKILDFNQAAYKMLGYTKNELSAMTVLQLSAAEEGYNKELTDKKLKEILEKGSLNFEWRLKRYGGEIFWSDIKIKVSFISGEKRIITIVRDITEQKTINELITASEEHLRTIISNIPGAVYRCEVEAP